MNKLIDAHYFPIPSQGNIYTFSKLKLTNGTNKLLVATLNREVFCFEYLQTDDILVPTVKEISFTYIPSGAEIISIDAFNKSEESDEFVIGITIIKNGNDLSRVEAYLNIYSESEESKDFNIESIAQNCLNVELNFIPYHLTHTSLVIWNGDTIASKEVVFILTGMDRQVHVYRENLTSHYYKEIDKKDLFPEFHQPPSIVLWVDVHYFNNYSERVTVFGCECGYMRLCRVNVKTNEIVLRHSTRFPTPTTCARIFPERDALPKPACLENADADANISEDLVLNMVTVNNILPPVVFVDILRYGIEKTELLPRSDMVDVYTSVEIADIDFDGCKEIIFGSTAEEVLLYKYRPNKGWCFTDSRKVASPVSNVGYLDLTGDGVKELVVVSIKGVYIFQHDFADVQDAIERKLKSLSIPNIETLSLQD